MEIHHLLSYFDISRKREADLSCLLETSFGHEVKEHLFARMPHLHRNGYSDLGRDIGQPLKRID